MFTEGYSFPHPVLGNDDDITGELNISLELIRATAERKILFEIINVDITNQYIKQLVENGFARIFIKIYCSSTMTTWIKELTDKIEINEDDLVNKVEVQVLIITNSEISGYTDSSFNPQYEGEIFTLNKNEVIGISGKVNVPIPKVNENLGLGNIFKFYSQNSDTPVNFQFSQDKIFINYPLMRNGDHPQSLLFQNSPWIAFNIFIVPALSEALRFIKDYPDEVINYEWYSVIDQLLPSDLRTPDYFSDAQKILQSELPLLLACEELLKNQN